MNSNEPIQGHRWWTSIFGCLVLILISLIVANDLRGFTTVVIDNKNTVRLGGVVPLRNKAIRDSVLRIMSHLKGAKFAIVADESAKFSTVVEVMDSMRSPGVISAPPPRTNQQELR